MLARHGIVFSFVDTTNPENVAAAIQPNTKLVWLETPTNPMLKGMADAIPGLKQALPS